MNLLFWISLLLFIAGAIAYRHVKSGYSFSLGGSVAALLFGCGSLNHLWNLWSYALGHHIILQLGTDHLSAIFMIIASISWIALSLYSIDYSKFYPQRSLVLGINLCFLGMMLILNARDGITLLVGWEVMTIFAFVMMLAAGKHFEQSYRFLAFGELSTMCLLLGFAVLYKTTGSVSFETMRQHGNILLFILLSLGFIIKMDIIPFHAWMHAIYGELPDNTAAVLSAPVTLMGVYGLERIIQNMPGNTPWSIVLILLGALSAFWGGLQAVAASKIRLLPAYSTVENNGMILTAIGFYAIAKGFSSPVLQYLAVFSLVASLVLALSHTLAKTLLFMSIGHAKEAYGVHTIDQARGVWSGVGKIPSMGIIISALSFSAFPPLIGYVGEWMILEMLFQSYRFQEAGTSFLTALAGVLIALATGLIAFAMIKLIGYTALGYDHGRKSRQIPHRFMHWSELGLEFLIVFCGAVVPAVIILFGFPQLLTGLLGIPAPFVLASGEPIFGVTSPTLAGVILLVLLIVPVLIFIKTKRHIRKVNSWNGGVVLAEDEFFTARAYSQILEHILKGIYRTKEVTYASHSGIEVEDILTRPTQALTRIVEKIGEGEALAVMNGKISAYVTYILILFVLVFIIGMIAM